MGRRHFEVTMPGYDKTEHCLMGFLLWARVIAITKSIEEVSAPCCAAATATPLGALRGRGKP